MAHSTYAKPEVFEKEVRERRGGCGKARSTM